MTSASHPVCSNMALAIIKKVRKPGVEAHTSISALRRQRQRQEQLRVRGQPGLYSEFQVRISKTLSVPFPTLHTFFFFFFSKEEVLSWRSVCLAHRKA